MATAEEIRNKAAKKLGIFGTGQTIRSEIAEDVDNAYSEVYAQLDTLNLTTWDEDESVPSEFVKPVVDLVAYARVDEYSVSDSRYTRIRRDALGDKLTGDPSARQVIKELQASNVYSTPKPDYY